MKIRNLALDIDDVRSPTIGDENSDFQFRNRSFCNFLARESGAKKFVTDGFNLILISGVELPGDSHWGTPVYKSDVTKTLISEVPHRLDEYRKLPLQTKEQNEFFIAMAVEGLRGAAKCYDIPINGYQDAIQKFRDGGYQNEWILKKQKISELDVQLQLKASLSIFECNLSLLAFKGKELVADTHVANVPPDEQFFLRFCRNIKLRNGRIVLTDWIYEDKLDVWSIDAREFLYSE